MKYPLDFHVVAHGADELADRFAFLSGRLIESWPFEDGPVHIECRPAARNRSLNQNALFQIFYREIAAQKGDMSEEDVRRYCKLHFGVPILRRGDEAFRDFYAKALIDLDYEDKLRAMAFVPVTSRMSKPQATQYIEDLMDGWGREGIHLSPMARDHYARWLG
jgi:hypothetical protein